MHEQTRVNRVVRALQRAEQQTAATTFAAEAGKLLEEMHTRLRELAGHYVHIQE